MRPLAQLRKRYDRQKVLSWIGRLWSWVGVGIGFTMAAFVVVLFADKFQHRVLELVFTGIGCIALCVTVLLVAAYSFLGALDDTLRAKRGRFGRILGAWLFSAPFIAGVLFMGYMIFRWVFIAR